MFAAFFLLWFKSLSFCSLIYLIRSNFASLSLSISSSSILCKFLIKNSRSFNLGSEPPYVFVSPVYLIPPYWWFRWELELDEEPKFPLFWEFWNLWFWGLLLLRSLLFTYTTIFSLHFYMGMTQNRSFSPNLRFLKKFSFLPSRRVNWPGSLSQRRYQAHWSLLRSH